MGRIKSAKGFLLLEAIMTIAVMTFGLVFLTRAYGVCKKLMQKSEETLAASLLLERKMQELETVVQPGVKAGNFGDDYFWKTASVSLKDAAIRVVSVEVWKKTASPAPHILTTWLKNESPDERR